MAGENFEKGDIIEITGGRPVFHGCLAVVDVVRGWGVVADVTGPGDATGARLYPVRLAWDEFARTGGRISTTS